MDDMEEEDVIREIGEIMQGLSLNRQRYLLELARASKRAERNLEPPQEAAASAKEGDQNKPDQ